MNWRSVDARTAAEWRLGLFDHDGHLGGVIVIDTIARVDADGRMDGEEGGILELLVEDAYAEGLEELLRAALDAAEKALAENQRAFEELQEAMDETLSLFDRLSENPESLDVVLDELGESGAPPPGG